MPNPLIRLAHVAYVALGSNMGDRQAHLERALKLIAEIKETVVKKTSKFKSTQPEGVSEGQEDYLNGVTCLETELGPIDLLEKLQIIERKMGRMQKGNKASRPIDLDILIYDNDVIIKGKTLTIPHSRLHERRFVLEPLADLAPDWVHPVAKKTASKLLEDL
jgi:2-amino-4-hydroxy-6-hydroxymethyldihydropteridine diphosphokinase